MRFTYINKLVFACAAAVLMLTLAAPRAAADTVSYDIVDPNAALVGYTPPYATVEVNLTDSTHATLTFTSLESGGYIFRMGGNGAADVNVDASTWTIGTFTASGTTGGFTPGPLSDSGSKNISDFGVFNQTVDSFDGYTHSSDVITFVLTNTGGSWAAATDVLTGNENGYLAAIHGFVCAESDGACSSTAGAVVTGYAGNGTGTQVPEPASIALFGSGLVTLAGMIRKRRKQTKS
jgi:PEP-CTERM motif